MSIRTPPARTLEITRTMLGLAVTLSILALVPASVACKNDCLRYESPEEACGYEECRAAVVECDTDNKGRFLCTPGSGLKPCRPELATIQCEPDETCKRVSLDTCLGRPGSVGMCWPTPLPLREPSQSTAVSPRTVGSVIER